MKKSSIEEIITKHTEALAAELAIEIVGMVMTRASGILASQIAGHVSANVAGLKLAEGAFAPRRTGKASTRKAPAKRATTKAAQATQAAPTDRLPRRSPEDISNGVEKIRILLKKHPEGLNAEKIKVEIGVDTRELPALLKAGLKGKVLKSKGQKRATTYFLKEAKSSLNGAAASAEA